ncbi:MAG: hypothetical protein AB7N65_21080 [Vicinamibacterales bacterium]
MNALLPPFARRVLGRTAALCAIVAVSYLLVLRFPQPLFAHTHAAGDFVLHSAVAIPDAVVARVLEAATALIRHSEFYDPRERHMVFVTGAPWRHRLFNGPNTAGLARNSEIGERIFVPQLEPATAEVVHFDGRRAPAAPILAHEVTHTYVRRQVGLLSSLRLPFWQREGYGEYIAFRDPATLPARIRRLTTSSVPSAYVNAAGVSVPRPYYEAGVVWEYLLDVEGRSAAQVLRGQSDAREVIARMTGWADRQTDPRSGRGTARAPGAALPPDAHLQRDSR